MSNTLKLLSGKLSIAHDTDAGYDIYPSKNVTIPPYSNAAIPTDLRVTLPDAHFALVKPRSGLSFKNDTETGAGVIDNGYSGEIMVKLYNNSENPLYLTTDKACAQLVLLQQPCVPIEVIGGEFIDALGSHRGENGFGSSDQPSVSTFDPWPDDEFKIHQDHE